MKYFVLIAAVCLTSTAAYAEIYQWKDANGKIVISDKPPMGATQQQKTFASESPASGTAAPKTTADKDMEFRKRQKEAQDSAEKSNKEQAAAAANKESCESARRYLKSLESGERISQTDDKGERYYLEDSQRNQEIAKTRQSIQTNCK